VQRGQRVWCSNRTSAAAVGGVFRFPGRGVAAPYRHGARVVATARPMAAGGSIKAAAEALARALCAGDALSCPAPGCAMQLAAVRSQLWRVPEAWDSSQTDPSASDGRAFAPALSSEPLSGNRLSTSLPTPPLGVKASRHGSGPPVAGAAAGGPTLCAAGRHPVNARCGIVRAGQVGCLSARPSGAALGLPPSAAPVAANAATALPARSR